MNCVNFPLANNYCAWVGKRLPTEWELEWVMRGRDEARIHPWGSTSPTKQTACWSRYTQTEQLGTCEVTAHPEDASRDGVLGLAGNVCEWTSSVDADDESLRVLRGGAWDVDDPIVLRAVSTGAMGLTNQFSNSGFRCVR